MSYDIDEYLGMDAVSGNAADFSESLMAMGDYVEGSIEKVVRKACIDLYRAIVERTPVDTGRAKANWMISTAEPDYTVDDKDGYSFNEVVSVIDEHVSEFDFDIHDGTVFITNNLEYISELENGSSDQAPYGMVSLSLAEAEAHFRNALAGLKGVEAT